MKKTRSLRSINARQGFTLVELLAVVGIIAVMLGLGVMALGSGDKAGILRAAVSDVRTTLMFAREYAMANNVQTLVVFPQDVNASQQTTQENISYLYPDIASRQLYLRGYAVYNERDGFVTPWSFLPNGLIFDVEESPTKNILVDEKFSHLVLHRGINGLDALPFRSSTTLFTRVQAIAFDPDGSVSFSNGSLPTGVWEIYITTGTTDADNPSLALQDACKYYFNKLPSGGRSISSVRVAALSGGFQIREYLK